MVLVPSILRKCFVWKTPQTVWLSQDHWPLLIKFAHSCTELLYVSFQEFVHSMENIEWLFLDRRRKAEFLIYQRRITFQVQIVEELEFLIRKFNTGSSQRQQLKCGPHPNTKLHLPIYEELSTPTRVFRSIKRKRKSLGNKEKQKQKRLRAS